MIFTSKRTEIEIVYDLLSSAQSDIKQTRLMYKVNMPYLQFKKYLKVLKEKGLLSEKNTNNNGGKIYSITAEGKELMKYLTIVKSYLAW